MLSLRSIRADRAWSHLTDAFAWLKLHSHPSDVSGKRHRLAIYQAVMYLAKFTERPMSKARQRWVIGAQTIAAISSLLSNDMNLDLQERACAALANILSNCTVRPAAACRRALSLGYVAHTPLCRSWSRKGSSTSMMRRRPRPVRRTARGPRRRRVMPHSRGGW